MSADEHLSRGVAVVRVVTLVYAAALFAGRYDAYLHPLGALAVLGGMAAWTVAVLPPVVRRWAPGVLLVPVLDLAVACAAVLATRLVDAPERIAGGQQTLPVAWPAAAVLAWAVWRGWRTGLVAACCVAAADLLVLTGLTSAHGPTLHNIVLLLLVGGVVGYSADLYREGRAALEDALAVRAASRERERLAREVHDGVLQVLALVQRRGAEAGGAAADLGRLAGEQERLLRDLVADRRDGAPVETGTSTDLLAGLRGLGSDTVTVVGPAGPVDVPPQVSAEVVAAVRAALDNVERHAGDGARAWVLLEDRGGDLAVTVRDDGRGFPAGRLAEAAAAGRLGVSASVVGRAEALGGHATYDSAPGRGTEVTLVVPREGARRG